MRQYTPRKGDGLIIGFADDRSVYYNGEELEPGPSQKLRNHSPDGFAWGYGGSGPAQLALAILLRKTNNPELALANYQQYKFDEIATIPGDNDFFFPIQWVDRWLSKLA